MLWGEYSITIRSLHLYPLGGETFRNDPCNHGVSVPAFIIASGHSLFSMKNISKCLNTTT